MRVFSILGATHYCASFQPQLGDAEKSPQEFRDSKLSGLNSMTEGTALFGEYRACALRDVERSLLLSATHYRRGLDMMIPSSSHWALVTFYYGAWFAARGLLGLFGCSVLNKHVIHVGRSSPGNQQLLIERVGSGQSQYYVSQSGSHRRFWEIFYRAVGSIRSFVDAQFSPTLSPIASNDIWLIEQRNKYNYDTVESINLGGSFGTNFSEHHFPASLPGALHTQYTVCEGILAVGMSFATAFGLLTDALDVFGPSAPIRQRINDLVYNAVAPDVVGMTRRAEMFG